MEIDPHEDHSRHLPACRTRRSKGEQEKVPGAVTPLICKGRPSFLKGCYGLPQAGDGDPSEDCGTLGPHSGVSEALNLQDEAYALPPRLPSSYLAQRRYSSKLPQNILQGFSLHTCEASCTEASSRSTRVSRKPQRHSTSSWPGSAGRLSRFISTSWTEVPAPRLCCPFRIFPFSFFLKLFTLIKLNSRFWQNPAPGNILEKPHVGFK